MRRIARTKPFRLLPKRAEPMYAGADGWDGGACVLWLWWAFITRIPESE